jgi:hypothetical protein
LRDDTSNFGQAPRLGQWWVDDRGDKNPAESIDSSLDSVFLRHLGQVKLSATANRIDIMWDTTEVADEALASVVDRLTHCQADVPVKLYFFYYGWVSETYKHRKDAIERIMQVQSNRTIAILHPTMIDNHDFSDIENASPLIRRGYEIWDKAKGKFDNVAKDTLSAYLPHTLIYQLNQREDELVFSWIGDQTPSARIYGEEWANLAVGEHSASQSEQETAEFMSKISAAMHETLETGEPHLQHIRTLMEDTEQEPFWLNYERLITLHRMADGREGVDVLCNLSQNLSIPLAG